MHCLHDVLFAFYSAFPDKSVLLLPAPLTSHCLRNCIYLVCKLSVIYQCVLAVIHFVGRRQTNLGASTHPLEVSLLPELYIAQLHTWVETILDTLRRHPQTLWTWFRYTRLVLYCLIILGSYIAQLHTLLKVPTTLPRHEWGVRRVRQFLAESRQRHQVAKGRDLREGRVSHTGSKSHTGWISVTYRMD